MVFISTADDHMFLKTNSGTEYHLSSESEMTRRELQLVTTMIGDANGQIPIIFNKALGDFEMEEKTNKAMSGQIDLCKNDIETKYLSHTENSKGRRKPHEKDPKNTDHK